MSFDIGTILLTFGACFSLAGCIQLFLRVNWRQYGSSSTICKKLGADYLTYK